MVRTYPRLCS
jgi:hypothetical protein